MEIIDITPLISPEIAVWPGDTTFSRQVLLEMKRGDHLTLSSIQTTVHLGAHTDGPNHYLAGGQDIAQRPLETYLGPAQVISVDAPRNSRVERVHLRTSEILAPRILLKTGSFPDPNRFNEDYCSLSESLVDEFASRGVILVGIDTPSVDPFTSKALEAHHRIAAHDMAILEGIVLSQAPDGLYELIALPLKLAGADASPVRAILVRR